ncbi:hypothetical protein Q8F55_004334 [Vanrija albida]|uniref:IMD domain-containing protein n=1 Tax=Vanrija albida TaxID=181172 RepID=A0ABR3Q735_9TREE
MQSASSLGWPRPPSPTFSTTTTGSKVNLADSHTLISRKDLRASIACFEDLMAAAKAYRNALLAMSGATAAFASAMEACSRIKGCRGANAALAGGAGLQFLISNHEQILADTVYRQFEIPLLEALDNYKLITADRLAAYEKALHQQSDKIRRTEAENMKIGRRRKRDLNQFRQALADLQRQVDELDAIKLNYHEEVLESEEEAWDTVLGKVAFVIRSQLDFYEKIAGKASDPILEPLVMSIPDPFDAYGPPKEEGQIFSVLSPLGLDTGATPPTPNLTRISHPSSSSSTPRNASPSKIAGFSTLAQAQTSVVAAVGERGLWDESSNGRAKRELSVIDERDPILSSPAKSTDALSQAETLKADTLKAKEQAAAAAVPFPSGSTTSDVDGDGDEHGDDHDKPTVDEGSTRGSQPPESTHGSPPRLDTTTAPVGVTA